MADERSVDFVLRVRDQGLAAFGKVQGAVDKINKALDAQATAGERAANVLDREAARLETLNATMAETERFAKAAAVAQSLFSRDMEGATDVTARQRRELEKLNAVAETARDRAGAAANAVSNQRGALVAAGASDGTADTARRAAVALREEATALETAARAEREKTVAARAAAVESQKQYAAEERMIDALRTKAAATAAQDAVERAAIERTGSRALREIQLAAAFDQAEAEALQLTATYGTLTNAQRLLLTETAKGSAALREQAIAARAGGRALSEVEASVVGVARRVTPAMQDAAGVVRGGTPGKGGDGGRPGAVFLGLRPYELQNLSYQINDVFTQLASGTSVTQTLAQQGGQIFQIFPRAGLSLLKFLPVALPVVAAVGTLFASVSRLFSLEAAARRFTAQLALSVDGIAYQATRLADTQAQLQRFGVGFDEAGQAISTFVKAGLPEAQLLSFGKRAKELATILGIEVPEAARKLADGLTKGYEGIANLDNELNFLSVAQRENIRVMFEQGEAAAALDEAQRILFERTSGAARDADSEWTKAFRAVGNAWRDFLDFLGDSFVVDIVATSLKGLALQLGAIAGLLSLIRREQGPLDKLREVDAAIEAQRNFVETAPNDAIREQFSAELEKLYDERIKLQKQLTTFIPDATNSPEVRAAEQAGLKRLNDMIAAQKEKLRQVRGVTDEERLQLVYQKALLEAQKNLGQAAKTEAGQALAVQYAKTAQLEEEEKLRKEREAESRRADAAGRRADAEARRQLALDNKRLRSAIELEKALRQSEAGITADLDTNIRLRIDALDSEFDRILQKLKEFQELGGTEIGGKSIDDYRAALDDNRATQEQIATLDAYQEALERSVRARTAIVRSIEDLASSGAITSAEAANQIEAAFDQAATTILPFVDKIRGFVNDLGSAGKLTAQQIGAINAELDSTVLDQQRSQLDEYLRLVDSAVSRRDQYVQDVQTMADSMLITQAEANERINAAFATTDATVTPLLDKIRQFIADLGAAGALSAEQIAALNARIKVTESELDRNTAQARKFSTEMRGIVTGGVQQGFRGLAAAIAGFADGTMGAGDALKSLGQTALSVFASMLEQIAMLIIQMIILNALGYPGAGGGGGGGGGFNLGSLIFGTKHDGGVAGDPGGRKRRITASPRWLDTLPRYHSGRSPTGLAANEIATVLEKDEEVITRKDPRHTLNGGKDAAAQGSAQSEERMPDFQIVNTFDEQSFLAAALNSRAGQRTLLNAVRANRGSIRRTLGS